MSGMDARCALRISGSRFAVSILVILAVIALFGIGCTQRDKKAGPREKITIAYTSAFDAVLVHIAFAKGFFAEEGLDAIPQPYAFGKLALESVLEGKADLAAVGDTPFVFAVMNGKKITTIATILASNRNNAIVARKDRGIAKPSDLLGKKIGVTFGTTGDFFLYSFLRFHGIDEKQVNASIWFLAIWPKPSARERLTRFQHGAHSSNRFGRSWGATESPFPRK